MKIHSGLRHIEQALSEVFRQAIQSAETDSAQQRQTRACDRWHDESDLTRKSNPPPAKIPFGLKTQVQGLHCSHERNNLLQITGSLAMLVVSASAAVALAAHSPTMVCGLTGTESTTCCWEQKDGKLLCKHTGKVLEKCCCTTK